MEYEQRYEYLLGGRRKQKPKKSYFMKRNILLSSWNIQYEMIPFRNYFVLVHRYLCVYLYEK